VNEAKNSVTEGADILTRRSVLSFNNSSFSGSLVRAAST